MAETKSGSKNCEVKMTEGGRFSGILSTYGNVDLVGDIVEAGAFDADVSVNGVKRPLLWQHDQHEPIGSFTIVSTADSLAIEGTIDTDTTRGKDAYSLLSKGHINGLSIGYNAIDYEWDAQGIRHLRAVQLLEGSLVTMPANPLATAQAKAVTVEELGRMASFTALSEDQRTAIMNELNGVAPEPAAEPDTPSVDTGIEQDLATIGKLLDGTLDTLNKE